MDISRRRSCAAGLCAFALAALVSACSGESGIPVIRAVSLVPSQTPYAKDFRALIEDLNRRGEGLFKIVYVGGPEAVPTYEQADAVRTGVVHMVFGPGTYYLGTLPEIEAVFASNLPPWETRANGGLALLDRLHRQRMGARYLARAMFIEFHLYTRSRPKFDAAGLPDLRGLYMRGGPVWRDFITSFGATFVNLAAPDIYTALERGTIDGISWPIVSVEDASWDRHLKYRIDPGVFSSDIGIIFNAEKWAGLPEQARSLIEQALIDYERSSYERFLALTHTLDKRMRERGIQVIKLRGAAAEAYRQTATRIVWERIAARAPDSYAELRSKFYRD